MAGAKICSINGCGNKFIARDMCGMHYQRWRKDADPGIVMQRAQKGEPLAWLLRHVDSQGDECLSWPFGKFSTGYGLLNLPDGGAIVASRQMCIERHGKPLDSKMQAAHSCGKGHEGCVNPRHLSWKTRKENESDKDIHGTKNHGSRNGRAKIDEATAKAIKYSPISHVAAAAKFGVSLPTIYDIRTGRSWSYLDRE